MKTEDYTIVLLVNNKPDVLARVSGIFSGRGFNIESISANVTMKPDVTKIIIITRGDSTTIGKIKKQLEKLVDVLEIRCYHEGESIQKEMVLMKFKRLNDQKTKIAEVIKGFNCAEYTIVAEDDSKSIIKVTGNRRDIDHILKILEPLGVEDMSRSGIVVL